MIPGSANPLLLATAAGAAGDYQIERSLRFNSADSAYLQRQNAAAGDLQVFTLAFWVKRTTLGGPFSIFGSSLDVGQGNIRFESDDTLGLLWPDNNVYKTTAVFRDTSAWYHCVVAVDTTASSGSRTRFYVNGVEFADRSGSEPNLNLNFTGIQNSGAVVRIGRRSSGNYLNGYLADIHFIDGQALDHTSFGEFDANGVWQPIDASGLTYGTNGFHLDFADNSSAAALGYDAAGSNDWTVNNLSVTAGAGNDSLVDSPTNGTQTDTGAGGEVVGNYCTLNPLSTTAGTYTQGNLRYVGASSWRRSNGTIAVTTGKWYWEVTLANAPVTPRNSTSEFNAFGFGLSTIFNSTAVPSALTDALVMADSGYYKNFANAYTDGGTAFLSGDVLSIAVDLDANTFTFRRNNTQIATGTIGGTAGRELVPVIISYNANYGVMDANFGQRPFAYTAPSGFKALCTANLPTPTIADGSTTMNVATWIGDGTSPRSITGLNHAPDIVWTKNRGVAYWHNLYDVIRGTRSPLHTNTTDTEDTANDALYGGVSAFDSDGFSLAAGTTSSIWANQSSQSFVGWCWDAGSSTGSNTDGSITSSVRANANGGISIVSYTGTGNNATVGHGLGVALGAVIIKSRNLGGQNWVVYIKDASTTAGAYMLLSSNAGVATTTSVLNGTNPTSSVFSIGTSTSTNNGSSTYIAYCFSPVVGFSAMGTYEGNGNSLGAYVYTGHRPRWIMVKRTDTTADWTILDTSREGYNVDNDPLYANQAYVEGTTDLADIVSNGFKLRTTDASVNASGGTYAYISFAEHPFSLARAR